MPLRSPRANVDDDDAQPERPGPVRRRVKWKPGMPAGPGQAASDLRLDARQAWRAHRASAADPLIIWVRKPSHAATANVAAHEKILAALARRMGAGAVWVRRELHRNAPPRILVYVGQCRGRDDAGARVHWGGWVNCVERGGRPPTGVVPLRAWSRWDTEVPQVELWCQGPPPPSPASCGGDGEAGMARWEGYVPEVCRGTRLAPLLRSYIKPVGARERLLGWLASAGSTETGPVIRDPSSNG
ncbi:hypothetical protein F5X96DRAFT_686308 [Biscogniauxia mediterranea]|nr:hypothetical protein F5X96DRAFT_686308 [Biscogniauxia mediterranea]